MPARILRVMCFVALALCTANAWAQNEGQGDLDAAIEAKIGANTLKELTKVIDLCESALEKGLEEEDAEFANKLLSSTLMQRGSGIGQAIFQGSPGDPRWQQQFPKLREMATKDLTRVTEIDPEQAEAHYLLGRLQSLPGGDREQAIASLDEAIRLGEDDKQLQAKALINRGGLQEDPEKRLADYTQAVELDSEAPEGLRARAMAYLEQDKTEEGLSDLDAALKIDPEHPGTHELRGVALAAQKKFDDALESLGKAIELDPRSPFSYVHRARIHIAQKKLQEAIHDLDKALLIQPSNVAVLLLRAGAYQQLDDRERAMNDVETALKLRPGLVAGIRARAMLKAEAGEFDEALEDLQEIADAAPEEAEPLIQIAMIQALGKENEEAIETYTKAIELEPELAAAYHGRADTLLRVGKQAEALQDYEEVLKTQPENTGVLNNMAWLLATSPHDELRDGKRSIELAEKACELTEYKRPHILSTLAAAYAETGDFEKAIEWSTKAVELGDDEEIKEQLQKELESYQAKKPWRELQDESSDTPAASVEGELPELPTVEEDEPATEAEPSESGDDLPEIEIEETEEG